MKVVIVGGGIAGLSTATRIAGEGHQVTLVERAPRLGGQRTRSLDEETGRPLDHGPCVFLGDHSRALLSRLGVLDKVRGLSRLGFIDVQHARGPKTFALKLPHERPPAVPDANSSSTPMGSGAGFRIVGRELPGEIKGAVDLLTGIAGFEALSWIERGLVLRVAAAVLTPSRAAKHTEESATADVWLERHSQSQNARHTLWRPLARLLLHDDPRSASARLLTASLKQAFLGGRDGSPVVARADVHELCAAAATRILDEQNVKVLVGTAVRQIDVEGKGDATVVRGVQLDNGERLVADVVVATVGATSLVRLLPPELARDEALFQGVARLRPSPSLTVHLWFDRALGGGDDAALVGSAFHWLSSTETTMHGGATEAATSSRVSLGAVAADELYGHDDEALRRAAVDEAAKLIPASRGARPTRWQIVREAEASIAQPAGAERDRPLSRTPVDGLFLAGAYVRTGLPATLESACAAADQASSLALNFEPPPPPAVPRGFIPASTLVRR